MSKDSLQPEFFIESESDEEGILSNVPDRNTRPISDTGTSSNTTIGISLFAETSNTSARETSSRLNESALSFATSPSTTTQSTTSSTDTSNVTVDTSSSSSQTADRASFSTRKRAVNLDKRRANVAKAALNAGEAHITSRGKFKEARSTLPRCNEKCHRCKPRLSEEQRQSIFEEFWSIQDHELQWQFILRRVAIISPQKKKEGAKNRLTTRKYSLRIHKTDYPVCKTMFLSTLSVCDSWVDSVVRKTSTCGYMERDQRGRHNNRPMRTSPETIASIEEHINSFERVPSHYCRKRSKREYLKPGLTVRQMHRMYKSWAKDTKNLPEKDVASERQYRKIFNTRFNIGFHQPRKDQCFECNRYKAGSKEDKERLKPRMVRHILNKEESKQLMEADKEEGLRSKDTLCVCSFDLQKVLPCPKSETSLFFYRNKQSLFNFTARDMTSGIAYCYVWDELTAKRGANEVASCLWDFILKRHEEGITEIRFYSDNCSGQNRNRFVFAMFKMAAEKLGIKIIHTFLEPGHTQMEVDGVHGRIENSTRHKEIFSKNEWMEAIETAKVEGEDYRVIPVTQAMIYDFKKLVEQQQWDYTKEKVKIKWGSVKQVKVDNVTPSEVHFKYFYRGVTHAAYLKKRGRTLNLKTYQLQNAYDKKIPLKPKKVRDIQFLCEKGAIPSKYHAEYSEILGFPVGSARCATWLALKDPDEMAFNEEETLRKATSSSDDQTEDVEDPPIEQGDDLESYLAENEEDAVPGIDDVGGESYPQPDEEFDLDEYFRKRNSEPPQDKSQREDLAEVLSMSEGE